MSCEGSKKVMADHLEKFYELVLIHTGNLLSEHQFIGTASIPVIKLNFDFSQLGYDEGNLEVDITLNDDSMDSHYQSIEFVKDAIMRYPVL